MAVMEENIEESEDERRLNGTITLSKHREPQQKHMLTS